MNAWAGRRVVGISAMVMTLCTVAYGGTKELEVLGHMPADFPVTVVVVDLVKLDGAVAGIKRRLDPGDGDPNLVRDLRSDLPFGDWVDCARPIGIASASAGKEKDIVLWVSVENFSEKVKKLDGATEQDGIWEIPADGDEWFFCKAQGNYVAAASSRERLVEATEGKRALGEALAPRIELLAGRDVFVRLNVDKFRPMLQQTIGQVAQMAPMMAMAAGQQGGGNPAMVAAMVTTLGEAAGSVVKQLDYIEASFGFSASAVDATLFTGFSAGPIEQYLSNQKPASMPVLSGLDEQPFFVAASYHMPGDSAPFMDYVFDRMTRAMLEAPPIPTGASPGKADDAKESAEGGEKDDVKRALRIAKELYSRIAGQNVVMAFSSEGMRGAGNYVAQDPQALLELVKQSVTSSNSLIQGFGGGASYEPLGEKQIDGTTVEEFALKIDTTNPAGVMAGNLYGQNVRFGLALAEGRVHFALGSEEYLRRAIKSTGQKPLASEKYVADALEALPKRRNLVLLCDLAGMMPFLSAMGPMFGLPKVDSIPPGPPVAISAALCDEPARVDIHVPIRAIERVKQAFAPDEPM